MTDPDIDDRAQALGERLQRLRTEVGLTQDELAARAGISVRTIGNIERGRTGRIQPSTRGMIALALGIDDATSDWLFHDAPTAPPLPWAAGDRFLAPLVGRGRELAEGHRLLAGERCPLLTVTGPGGIGKTRIARELAARLAAGGLPVHEVLLAGVADPADVLPAIAAAVLPGGVGADLREALRRGLRGRPALLLLDNLEHLLAAAPDIAWLLHAVPNLSAVATSREPLGIAGERVLALGPLDASSPEGEAVRLFLQQARRADPAIDPGPDDLAAAQEICRRVGGLPLAIELAAAQMDRLSPRHLLSLLDAAGLHALADGPRDAPARQASMDAVIGWSWDLLDDDLRDAMTAACTFAGGFDLEAMAAVLGAIRGDDAAADAATVRAVGALARKSLLIRQPPHPADLAPRYAVLEPIRQYGLERLAASGREDAFRRAHAEWVLGRCAALDAQAEEHRSRDRAAEFERDVLRLEREYPNVCAALDWMDAAGEREMASRLGAELKWLWMFLRRVPVGDRRVARLATEPDLGPAARFISLYTLAEEASREGDADALRAACDRMAAAAREHGDPLLAAMGLLYLTDLEDDPAAALAMVDEAAALIAPDLDWTELPFMQGWAQVRRGVELHRLGRLEEAHAALQAGIARKRREGNRSGLPAPLAHLGLLLDDLGQPRLAAETLLEAVAVACALGDLWAARHAARWLADLAGRHARPEAAGLATALLAALDAAADLAAQAPPMGPGAPNAFAAAVAEDLAAASEIPVLLPEHGPHHDGPREMAVRLE